MSISRKPFPNCSRKLSNAYLHSITSAELGGLGKIYDLFIPYYKMYFAKTFSWGKNLKSILQGLYSAS